MKNPLVIFARTDDPHPGYGDGTWSGLKCQAIDEHGRKLDSYSRDAAIVVLADDSSPSDMDLSFYPEHPVFWVEHGSKPIRDERLAALGNWPSPKRAKVFNHSPKRSYVYDCLKVLLGESPDADRRKAVTGDLIRLCTTDSEWAILNEFALIQSIKCLQPDPNVSAFEAAIDTFELGHRMLQRLKEGRRTVSQIIEKEVARLNAAPAA